MKPLAIGACVGATMLSLLPSWSPATAQSGDAASGKAAVLIFDASGSMWGQLDGGITKIEVARDVIGQFFATRDATIPLGVIAYGHNRRGDCSDIEVIARTSVQDPASLSQRLSRIRPRGMTPISDSLRIAASQIPPTAEEADIILVTDGLETCDADPCAVAAELAREGIKIRAHVVGFGLTQQEADALACVPDQTGGQLLRPQSGAELTDALNQIAAAEPAAEPQPEPEATPMREAAFDIGDKAEAGFTYRIGWRGEARFSDFIGFVPRGEDGAPSSSSFGPIGGSTSNPNNPATKTAPKEPGLYDLIMRSSGPGGGITARQAIEVVAPAMGFDAIGSVEPGSRINITFRGPEQAGERIVIADLDQPLEEHQRHGWAFSLSKRGATSLRAPPEPGEYELRYLNAQRSEVMFSRRFAVGIPFEDAEVTTSADLAARAVAATRAAPGQDALPMVRATFRIPDGFPEVPLWWSAVPLDPDMSPEAWAPQEQTWVAEGEFEPGRYEVSTTGPGETEFRGVVEVLPGQANDFVIPLSGGGEEDRNPPEQRGDAGPVEGDLRKTVTLLLPREVEDRPVQWSAIRLDKVMNDVEFAMNDYRGGFTTDLAIGRYEITGSGEDFELKGEIDVAAGGQSSFVVPLSTEAQAEDSEGMTCSSSAGCAFLDPLTGLALTLPRDWEITPPFFYETAGGAKARLPSATLARPADDGFQHIMLNPRQWMASSGPCVETPAGDLCRANSVDTAYLGAFEAIRASLKLDTASAAPARLSP
jgi:hypothetical protein